MTDKQRMWCGNAISYGGHFVRTFAKACYAADDENFKLLSPVLDALMSKYPKYEGQKAAI